MSYDTQQQTTEPETIDWWQGATWQSASHDKALDVDQQSQAAIDNFDSDMLVWDASRYREMTKKDKDRPRRMIKGILERAIARGDQGKTWVQELASFARDLELEKDEAIAKLLFYIRPIFEPVVAQ